MALKNKTVHSGCPADLLSFDKSLHLSTIIQILISIWSSLSSDQTFFQWW